MFLVQNNQYALQRLVEFNKKIGKSAYDVVMQCVKTAEILYRKYNGFRFVEGMIGVVKGPAIVMWIN